MQKPVVAVTKNSDIAAAVTQALDALSLPDLNGKKILLKPNIGREVDPRLGINTNPDVVAAIFHYLRKKFQAEFFIGDSPIISAKSEKAFRQSGYSELIDDSGLTFLDLDSPPAYTLPLIGGLLLKEIKVTGYFPTFDYIVSIPVLKMHMHTGMTLSFKNCKGLIYRREKVKLHHLTAPEVTEKFGGKTKELDIAIADLSFGLKPDLAIIDASYILEGMGPSDGNRLQRDMIIASTNFLAADIVAMHLVQPKWTLQDIPHLKLISNYLNGPKSIDEVDTIPFDISIFQQEIQAPPTSISLKYPNVRVWDIDSCSACLSTVVLFLKYNKPFIDAHFTEDEPLNLAIGRGIKDVHLYEPTFLIGNCTTVRKNEGIMIYGCAPVQSAIYQKIRDFLLEKGRLKPEFNLEYQEKQPKPDNSTSKA